LRVMIAAGGTGGHVYPALAAAESVKKLYPDSELIFVGTKGGFERPLIEHAGELFIAHEEVLAGPIHGVNPIRGVVSVGKLLVGITQSLRLLRKHKPQVILSTGGWVSLPVALAARILGVPLLVFLPDIEPGLTIKVLRLFARRVALTVPESAQYFKEGQTIVTGYPLREGMRSATREQGIEHFGLDTTRKTLLVFGGSRGSMAINIAFGDTLGELLEDDIQVLHITGTLDWEGSQERIGELSEHRHYHAYSYLHDNMALSLAAADLVVCRSGASILGEFPFFRLPSILIPLAYSWHYQQVNADYLAERGAAIHLDEGNMQDELLSTIRDLLGSQERLETMRSCAAELARPDGADNLALALAELVQD
jgi:UDP-N-acetylglucosamine--N-acetylmuramyl-(pentapeptide) pyrophosphoryl-undecaprenol N-acetylglucosamine transferase